MFPVTGCWFLDAGSLFLFAYFSTTSNQQQATNNKNPVAFIYSIFGRKSISKTVFSL
jgi:hypothetical protein